VSATHPISGAATAAKATPAPSAHSSLADFLLAGAPGNAGDDFRTIAATLFGVANSAPAKTQAPAKDPAVKEPGDIRKNEAKDDKDSSGQASALAAHPELSVALLNTAHASIQNLPQPVTPEPSKKAGSVSMPSSNGDDIAAKLAGNVPPNEGLALSRAWTNSLLPAAKQADIEALGAVDGEGAKEMPSGPGEGRTPVLQPLLDQPLGKQPLASDRVQQAKEGAPAIPSWFGSGMPGKKSAEPAKPGNTRLQEPGVDGAATRNSTQAPNIAKPILPADASGMASVNEVHPAATTTPPVPVPEQIAVGTAPQNAEVAATAAPQVSAAAVSLAAESRAASSRPSAGELSKIADRSDKARSDKIRSDKDRDSKDTPLTSGLSGKPGAGPAGQVAAGSMASGGNSKDFAGMVLSNHSGAHAKAEPAKGSSGASSFPAGSMEADGPDEAIPTLASSPLTAKFVQGMSQSEFRVGMQSPEFGNIDIRTSVTRHLFSAQISVEHGDMAKSLATELPGLYSKLADQHVPVANIVIQGQGLATSSGLAQHSQPQTWHPQSNHGSSGNTNSSTVEAILPVMTEGFDSTGRLDIRI
jgi:hypothetical protein